MGQITFSMTKYDSLAAGGPMLTDSSAILTNKDPASAIEWTATVLMPIFLAVRMILQAISPRFAISIFPKVF